MKKQKICKSYNGFIDSEDIPKTEIAPDNWCINLKECKNENNNI